jgi:small subunit ribosomal protein S17
MADEETKDEQEPTEATEEEATEVPAEGAKEEAPAEEAAPAPAAGVGEGGDEEPAEELSPKQRRKRERASNGGESRDPRSPEERQAEREAARKAKAAARARYRAARRAKKGEAGTGTEPAERVEGPKKVRQGIVTSARADKTITVQVESARRHPAYEKIVRRSKSLHAHDEANEAGEGDTVRVIETRPMSKTKRWRLVEVVEKAR